MWTILTAQDIRAAARFFGGSYAELPAQLLRQRSTMTPDNIRLTITTTQLNGVILWLSQGPSDARGQDYLALTVVNGRVVFRSDKESRETHSSYKNLYSYRNSIKCGI